MPFKIQIRLATPDDAEDVAAMSRDYVEYGLEWRWTPARVLKSVGDPETNVAVAGTRRSVIAFGIMQYLDDEAHLQLLAVRRAWQRKGVGSAVVTWLEEVARSAGASRLVVEVRKNNEIARSFYEELGFGISYMKGAMYGGVEDGLGYEKILRRDK